MNDLDLAAYQTALVRALVAARGDPARAIRVLRASPAAEPYAGYVDRFEPRLVGLASRIAKSWARREGDPALMLEVAGTQSAWAQPWRLSSLAAGAMPHARAPWVRELLRGASSLPAVADAAVYDPSSLSYVRPLDLLADAGLKGARGKKILDVGYRSVLPRSLLAMAGARVTGLDAAPGIADLRAVGRRFDVVLAKDVLARSALRASPRVKATVDREGTDDAYVAALASIVRPGGLVLLYNTQTGARRSGRGAPDATASPFSRATWKRAGFRVVAFDADDTPAFRSLARALEWGDATKVGATYTMVERR